MGRAQPDRTCRRRRTARHGGAALRACRRAEQSPDAGVKGALATRGEKALRRRSTTTLLAGWLFADVFLGIAFVALASDPALPEVRKPAASPSPSASPS